MSYEKGVPENVIRRSHQPAQAGALRGYAVNPLVTRALETVRTQGPGALVVKGVRYPLKPLLVARAARELAARSETAETTGDQIRLVESFRYAGIEVGSWQIRSEIEALLELLRSEQPKTVLEIGTAEGGTFFLFTRVASPDALLLTLDLPGGDFGGSYRAGAYRCTSRSPATASASTSSGATRTRPRRSPTSSAGSRAGSSTSSSSTATTPTTACGATSRCTVRSCDPGV